MAPSSVGADATSNVQRRPRGNIPDLNAIRSILNRDKGLFKAEAKTSDKRPDSETKEKESIIPERKRELHTSFTQELEAEPSNFASSSNVRHARPSKRTFKDRGSIASRLNHGEITIPHRARVKTTAVLKGKEKDKRVKSRIGKVVNVDVYIPTVVSVGHLARLLSVRLGEFFLAQNSDDFQIVSDTLQRKMVKAGMSEEASYDHSGSLE